MSHPTPTEQPSVRDDVVFRAIGTEWAIYDPDRGQLHVLNATAALVWSLCDGEHDAAGIADRVAETLGEVPDRSVVTQDVEEVLGRFAREGLLK